MSGMMDRNHSTPVWVWQHDIEIPCIRRKYIHHCSTDRDRRYKPCRSPRRCTRSTLSCMACNFSRSCPDRNHSDTPSYTWNHSNSNL